MTTSVNTDTIVIDKPVSLSAQDNILAKIDELEMERHQEEKSNNKV